MRVGGGPCGREAPRGFRKCSVSLGGVRRLVQRCRPGGKKQQRGVSQIGQPLQQSVRPLVPFPLPFGRICVVFRPALLSVFAVSSTHLLTGVRPRISPPSLPSTFPPFSQPDAPPSSRQVSGPALDVLPRVKRFSQKYIVGMLKTSIEMYRT